MFRPAQNQRIAWQWDGATIELDADWCGQGPTVLLLPALSSISTRHEMRPLQERLSTNFRTVSIDWPGFGDRPRPRLDWRPETYKAFLNFIIATLVSVPRVVVAAGHAATYALAHACAFPNSLERLVLVAPTWRGPLPTMMNGYRPLFDHICRLVDRPVVGPLLYRLNVNRPVVRYLAAGHVYSDPAWLRGALLSEKLAVTRAPGARFSSVRFVTGKLDPLATRAEFLDLAQRSPVPMLVIYGAETPSRSRATAVPCVQSACLPRGKLSVHEEFPDLVAEAIEAFLVSHP